MGPNADARPHPGSRATSPRVRSPKAATAAGRLVTIKNQDALVDALWHEQHLAARLAVVNVLMRGGRLIEREGAIDVWLELASLVSARYGLDEWAGAFHDLVERSGLKVVVEP